jgi:hypothetical protein
MHRGSAVVLPRGEQGVVIMEGGRHTTIRTQSKRKRTKPQTRHTQISQEPQAPQAPSPTRAKQQDTALVAHARKAITYLYSVSKVMMEEPYRMRTALLHVTNAEHATCRTWITRSPDRLRTR